MVALIAGSGTVVSDAGPPGVYDMRAQPDVDGVQQAALRSIDAVSMWRLFEAVRDPQPSSGLSFQTVLRETSLRNTSYPHMLRDTLDELFSAPDVIADCQTAIGATPQEIIRVVDALSGVRGRRWQERFAGHRKVEELARNWRGRGVSGAASEEEIQALAAVWATPSAAAVLDVHELATETGLSAQKVESILDLFTADLENEDATVLVERFFGGENPFRLRPLLRHPSGRRVVVHEGLLIHAVRERVEEALKVAHLADRYFQKRGTQLEVAALRHLKVMLPSGSVRGSFEYFIPWPDHPAETNPDDFTKLVESDGLLLVDDVAIVLEAKSGALSARARAGDPKRLHRDLTSLVTDAASQASRMRVRITTDVAPAEEGPFEVGAQNEGVARADGGNGVELAFQILDRRGHQRQYAACRAVGPMNGKGLRDRRCAIADRGAAAAVAVDVDESGGQEAAPPVHDLRC
jgi:hypothetical protein